MKHLFVISLCFLVSGCSPYLLADSAADGDTLTAKGTVLSIESDGDFVMESSGKFLFVDADDIKNAELELGDRVIVTGEIDIDEDDTEAPELDAKSITDWHRK